MNKRWVGAHAAGAPVSAVCIKPRMVQTICLALMGPRGRLLCHYGTTRRGCGQLRGFGLLGRCIVPMSYREASVFGPMRSLMIFGLTPAFRAPVTYEWRSAMEGNAWEHGRRGEAVEPLSDRRRMPRASVRATGLPVAPIRLRRRQRTDGPRTPTDLREDPRTRNDVQDADESLASWTRHRIGVRQRHRRRITGAPARFACPFLEPPSERLPISKAVVTVEDPYLTHPAWRVQSASASPGSAKTTLIEHRQIRARPSDVPPNLVATSAHTYARRLAASLSRCRAARAITCCLLRPRPSNRAGSAPDGSRSGAQFAA